MLGAALPEVGVRLNVTHLNTINLDIHIFRFVVLYSVLDSFYMGQREYVCSDVYMPVHFSKKIMHKSNHLLSGKVAASSMF